MQVNVSRVEALTILATLLQPQHAILGAQLIEVLANSGEHTSPARYAAVTEPDLRPAPRKARGRAKAIKAAPKADAAPTAKPAKQKPVKAAKRGSAGAKRSPEALAAQTDAVLGYIRANPGQGAEQIAKGLGTDTKTNTLPIKKLLADRMVTMQGQKRAARYFPATVKASKHANGLAATAAE